MAVRPVPRFDIPACIGTLRATALAAGGRRLLARCIITVLPALVLFGGGSSATASQPASLAPAFVPAAALASEPVRVAAASSLRAVWPRLMQAAPVGLRATISYGSSGNLARQIIQGAPFDLFLSASEQYVQTLRDALDHPVNDKVAPDRTVQDEALTSKVYALGQLALVTREPADGTAGMQLDGLAEALQVETASGQSQRRLAIANPAHAPYGQAAREVLEHTGAWATAAASLSLAENAAQTLQFVRAGAVWAALVPRSLVSDPALRENLHVVDVDTSLHTPIQHEMVLLTPDNPAAAELFDFLHSDTARGILAGAGFGLPTAVR